MGTGLDHEFIVHFDEIIACYILHDACNIWCELYT